MADDLLDYTFKDPNASVEFESTGFTQPEPGSVLQVIDGVLTWVLEDAAKDVINSVAVTSQERQAMVAADGATLRLIYGRQRVGAQIAYVKEYNTNIYVLCVWCLGEVNAVESILLDGEEIDPTWVVEDYVGTTDQVANPTLAYLDSGYSDTLVITKGTEEIGVCYSVLKIPDSAFPNRIEGIIQGKIVYDPRIVGYEKYAYSTNPSLCLNDFSTSTLYGQGKNSNSTALTAAANANDAVIPGTTDKRRELNLVISSPAKTSTYVDVLRTYAGCFVSDTGDDVEFIPNIASTATRSLTEDDIVGDTLRVKKSGNATLPTVMKIIFTDMTAEPWKDQEAVAKLPGVDTGTVPWRESTVQLQGITTYAQAYREAVERLNKLNLCDLSCSFVTFDEGMQDQIGDVIELTHSIGLVEKQLRILNVESIEPGRWLVTTKEYNGNVYSDEVETIPDHPDSGASQSLPPWPPSSLVLTEMVTDLGDGEYISRLQVDFSVVKSKTRKDPESFKLHVISHNATVYSSETIGGIEYTHGDVVTMYTGYLLNDRLHTIYVYAYNTSTGVSDALTGTITIDGI